MLLYTEKIKIRKEKHMKIAESKKCHFLPYRKNLSVLDQYLYISDRVFSKYVFLLAYLLLDFLSVYMRKFPKFSTLTGDKKSKKFFAVHLSHAIFSTRINPQNHFQLVNTLK